MFQVINDKGFRMTFANGLTISVCFDINNYCIGEQVASSNGIQCKNAEIAIWDEKNNWYNFGNDTVKGFVSVDEVALIMDKIRQCDNLDGLKDLLTKAGI